MTSDPQRRPSHSGSKDRGLSSAAWLALATAIAAVASAVSVLMLPAASTAMSVLAAVLGAAAAYRLFSMAAHAEGRAGDQSLLKGASLAEGRAAGYSDKNKLMPTDDKLRRFAESDLIGIVFGDVHGRIDYANDEYLRIIGYGRDEFAAGTIRWDEVTPPEWRHVDTEHIEQAKARGACSRYEKEYLRKDGIRVPVLVGHIIFGDKEDIAVAFVLDLSEQKRTERELKRRDQEFRMLADHMSQLAWMADESGAITWYNRRWLDYTGTTIEQMQRSGWQGVVHPDHVEHVFRKITQCYKTGEPWEETFPLRGKSGSWRWFLSRAVPIRDAQGKINRWFGTCTDVTEQREMEQELKEANRRKDEFLATLAHELRNPLAPISSGLTLMKLSSPDSTAASKARDIMDRQLAHMVRLIDDLLDVSRISRGKLELRRERVSVQMIVDSAVEVSKPLIEDDEHALTVSLPPQPLHIDADPVRIAQVISNLLNNAAKYTPQGGSIGLFAQQEGSAVVIRVKDSGIGITPEALPRVFEMFTQVNRTVERAKGGLGIGLSVAKQLVELHGGILTAQSDGAGLGSTFTVWLPLAESIRKTQAMPSESTRLPALESKRILVVDDNEDAAETLVMLLELNGHKMRTAHNGPDALRIARDFKPDLVFLDIGLPGMNGYEVAERVRAEPDLSHTVLVALTGWGSEEDKRRSTKAGFDFHLTKPVMAASLDIIFAQLV